MKIKNKGKVHPSSDSSPSIKDKEADILSILKLLPAAILALVSVLSLDEKQVLAYMITRSFKTTLTLESKKKPSSSSKIIPSTHSSSLFDCDCFDCYTSYWQKWNDSPNHQLIQQAIEAFEDHLSRDEKSRKSSTSRSRKNKNSRKLSGKSLLHNTDNHGGPSPDNSTSNNQQSSISQDGNVVSSSDDVALASVLKNREDESIVEELGDEVAAMKEETQVTGSSPAVNSRKGIARKVLPDVLGILNSRLWNLWGPNVQ